MSKKSSRIMAAVMLFCAVAFVFYAFRHPEGSFPWNNLALTYGIFITYLVIMIILFIAPFK